MDAESVSVLYTSFFINPCTPIKINTEGHLVQKIVIHRNLMEFHWTVSSLPSTE